MHHIHRALLGASIAAIAFAGQAHAQAVTPSADASAQQPVEAEDASQAADSNDIVVTANKREQRLNDVGITVAVVSGNDLQNRQINSLADLANATPSLSFTNSAKGSNVYSVGVF